MNLSRIVSGCLAGLLLSACSNYMISPPIPSTNPPLAKELIFFNWVDYMPQTVLDAFTAEYGVKVEYKTYETLDEAIRNIKSGMPFDVAVVEHDLIPDLASSGLLAEMEYRNIPNFKNISPDFRDLIFDPGDRHSVSYSWGTTGILVRTDLVELPITRWADLWDNSYSGRIAVRPEPVEMINLALKSLGYPLNSENPEELEAALQRLLVLKPSLLFVSSEDTRAVDVLLDGRASLLVGWPGDALDAQHRSRTIQYILPNDGTILWGDRFVISADSPNKYTAEIFLNFLLRPEIAGEIVNENHYAIANEAAYYFINPEILNNPIIFPSADIIQKADWYLPLSPAGEKLYASIWEQFLAGQPQ